ncbi:CDP-alcohol phosphatidyltransferase family protein [Clostridium sp.]|uniref:CDP-alcohol phosphatidyltransferase family protein n=1 Tax=Clostridium sp. TaxID=1506 RepID=UPI002FC5C8A9
MLDTKGRKYIQPLFEKVANFTIKRGITANQVTIVAFLVGIIAAIAVCFGNAVVGVALLWLSGFLDALDGTIARKTNSSSSIGTLMDILFDRIVEIAMLLAIECMTNSVNIGIYISIVLSAIIISMTVFLTVGALVEKSGNKSFYYQAGLAERTEGFIMISLAAILPDFREIILVVFAAMMLFTAGQRFLEAKRILK